jgi:RHS repeat-associated protein
MSRLSFDPWGRRRAGATWTGNPTAGEWTTITNTTRRGFTFHEELDNLGLVHMNGRVYDPVVARFLSADPIVQDPSFSQSFNRYSYTFNNPLSFVDPSGYETETTIKSWINGPDQPMFQDSVADHIGDRTIVFPDTNWFYDYLAAGVAGITAGPSSPQPRPNIPDLRRDWTPDARPPDDGTRARPGYTGSTVSGPVGVPDWATTSGICLGGCHGTSPEGPLRPMTTKEALILDALGVVVTLPLGGEFLGAIKAGRAAAGASRVFWVGADGQAAAIASGGKLLKPSKAALEAAARGDFTLMRAESAAWARGATGEVEAFFGSGKGRIFLQDELPELLRRLESGEVTLIEITF